MKTKWERRLVRWSIFGILIYVLADQIHDAAKETIFYENLALLGALLIATIPVTILQGVLIWTFKEHYVAEPQEPPIPSIPLDEG